MRLREFFLLGVLFLGARAPLQAAKVDSAMSAYKAGRFSDAAHEFEKLLERPTSRSERRIIYLYMGKSYESAGRLDKAVSAYEESVRYDKKNWRRHRDLGGLYEQSDLPWKALSCYKKAHELNRKGPSLFLSMARVWRKIGLYANAVPWIEKAIAANPDDSAVLDEWAKILAGQGRFQEAAGVVARLSEAGPRLLVLAILGQEASLMPAGWERLRQGGASKPTIQAYENLVELLRLPPKEILAGNTTNSILQDLLKSPFKEGSK